VAGGERAFAAALEDAADFDARVFAEFIVHHKLLPWLATVGTGERPARLLPAGLVAQLRETRAEQPRVCQRLLSESRAVDAALAGAGVEHLFIKGLFLGQRLYGDSSRRHQFDVDVLVRPADFERALSALADDGWELCDRERLRPIRRGARDAWHALTLRRQGCALDLHWCLRNRNLPRVDEEDLWRARQRYRIDDAEFETLSDADTLTYLLASIGLDLRRGALRAKLLLDLERALERIGRDLDWEAFLSARAADGLLPLVADVLAVFFHVWDGASEPPALAAARAGLAPSAEAADAQGALALVTRPRNAPENRAWFDRIAPKDGAAPVRPRARGGLWPRLRRVVRASQGT
jgi:hypothetical protein